MIPKELFEQARKAIPKIGKDGQLHELSELELGPIQPGLVQVLNLSGSIRTTKGTSRIYFENLDNEKSTEKVNDLERLIEEILNRIKEAPNNSLPKSDVITHVCNYNFDEYDYYSIVQLLSMYDLATSAGRGPTGGIRLYNQKLQHDETEKVARQLQDADAKGQDKEKIETEREPVLYPAAEKFISDMGYEAITLGNRRRFKGEWNTPDVIGFKMNKLYIMGGVRIEVITVEVKWSISKLAIAEANSHQRLGHKSYLMVHTEITDIDEIYLLELMEKGIGLICLKEAKPTLHSAAKFTGTHDVDVDSFLNDVLNPEAKDDIKDEISKFMCQYSLGRIFLK